MSILKKILGKDEKETPQPASPPPAPEPEPIQVNEIMPDELMDSLNNGEEVVVVDLRQPWEHSGGHIPGAINIPITQLTMRLDEIPKDKKVVMQCYHGISSLDASGYLIHSGWEQTHIFSLNGGITGWIGSQGIESLER